MPIRLLHLSDLHLGAHGSYLGQRAEARRPDFQIAFEKAVSLACEAHPEVHAVVICGDLFDTHRPAASLVHFAKQQFQRLQDAGIDILLIPGFHDALAYPDCVYHTDTFPGVHLLTGNHLHEPLDLTLNGIRCRFYTYPWQDSQQPEALPSFRRTQEGDLHIALLHAPVADKSPHGPWIPLPTLADSGMDYVALGYEHNYQTLTDRVACSGTLEATEVAEASPRGFLLVDLDPSHLQLTRIPYETRPVRDEIIDLSSSTARETEDLVPLIGAFADPLCLARVRLQGTAEFVINVEVLKEALTHQFFYLEIEDETRFSNSALVRIIQSEPTIRGLFAHQLVEQMAPGRDEEVLEFALKSGLQRFLEEELL